MDLLNETVLLKAKSTLFNLFIRETSQFLCYERLLNMTYVAYKNAFSAKCNPGRIAILLSHIKHYLDYQYTKFQPYTFRVQKNVCFCTKRDFGSPTNIKYIESDYPFWADEIAIPRPDINIKITAFTVTKKFHYMLANSAYLMKCGLMRLFIRSSLFVTLHVYPYPEWKLGQLILTYIKHDHI